MIDFNNKIKIILGHFCNKYTEVISMKLVMYIPMVIGLRVL